MKPTPFFVAALVGLILIGSTVWIIATLHNAAINKEARRMLQSQRQMWTPPKIECPQGQELWDCIRFVKEE